MNDANTICALIVAGRHPSAMEGFGDGLDWSLIARRDAINCQTPEFWKNFCSDLSVEDHISLFRGLVIAEREFHWVGGSVAAAIWVFKLLSLRISVNRRSELLDWALRHRGANPYVPLGSARYARSVEELKQEESRAAAIREGRKQERETRMNLQAEQRVERKDTARLHALLTTVRSQARRAAIQKVEELSGRDRFIWLLAQDEWPPSAMPIELFPHDVAVLLTLTASERVRLIERLRTARGEWGRLRKRLEAMVSGSHE